MKNVLVFDVETTGLDESRDRVVEVGACLWSVEHRTMLASYSSLLCCADENPAESVNGITAASLVEAGDPAVPWAVVGLLAERADVVVAHSAEFDRKFSVASNAPPSLVDKPWVCTLEDFDWPRKMRYTNLVSVALAHGVAVTAAHRTINDVMLIVRLFESLPDAGERLERALAKAQRPKAMFYAMTSYDEKDLVKASGFHWDGERWTRFMAIADAERLPFTVNYVQAQAS